MAWKILSALSALCLAGSSFFAWKNAEALKNEKAREEYTNKSKDAIVAHKKAAEESKTKHTAEVAEANKELEATKTSVADTATKAADKEKELATVKTQLDDITKVVNGLQDQIDKAGNIKALLATIETIKKERQDAEAKLANESQRFATAQETVSKLTEAAKSAEEREARGRKGIVEPDFTATVSQTFGDWGFVVLNKGNGGGVFANANLEVKRGKETVAKLRVRNVEQAASVADVVPGTLAEGTILRPGDQVVAAADQGDAAKTKAAPAAPATAAAPGAAAPPAVAAPAPAMGGDPFGAPAGGMAPAAPAPASDPFGAPPAGGMAPAAPAPASDPFGAPPAAPAPGAAPAAGTPAAPSTADPFGAAPPAKP